MVFGPENGWQQHYDLFYQPSLNDLILFPRLYYYHLSPFQLSQFVVMVAGVSNLIMHMAEQMGGMRL